MFTAEEALGAGLATEIVARGERRPTLQEPFFSALDGHRGTEPLSAREVSG
jgi:hypothetical protein